MTRTILIDGIAKRRVDQLQPGDRVDLEGDPIADPARPSHYPEFEFEFEVVMKLTRETTACLAVEFMSGFSCGFPPDHLVTVDGEQPETQA